MINPWGFSCLVLPLFIIADVDPPKFDAAVYAPLHPTISQRMHWQGILGVA